MKRLIPTLSLILTCMSLISCGSAFRDTVKEDSSNTVSQTETSAVPINGKEDQQESSRETQTQEQENNQEENRRFARQDADRNTQSSTNKQPKVGTVKKLVNGDLLCYVTLVDRKGIEHNVGATFEICAEEEKFLNKKVRATYKIQSVSDCESAEPCGKTRKESIITRMQVISGDSRTQSLNGNSKGSNSQTLSNDEWTITLTNTDSWNGVNGTGNVSYQGCDANGKCLKLKGGKVSCRDGRCITGWRNGDYVYILEQPMTEDGNATSTLTVRNNTSEVLKATGLRLVSGN